MSTKIENGFYISFDDNTEYLVVVYCPGYGAAIKWENEDGFVLNTHPELAKMVFMQESEDKIKEWFDENGYYFPIEGGLKYDLVEKGKKFCIVEYDGWEEVITEDQMFEA